MVAVQKYEGNGEIIELPKLPFGFNPQAALLADGAVKFQSHGASGCEVNNPTRVTTSEELFVVQKLRCGLCTERLLCAETCDSIHIAVLSSGFRVASSTLPGRGRAARASWC